MCDIELPYPPSTNTYYRNFRGRMVISSRGREYKKEVETLIKGMPSFGNQPVELIIQLFPRDKRLLDIDNSLKGLLDSIKGHLFDDDSQVWKLSIERKQKVKGGLVKVTILPYTIPD